MIAKIPNPGKSFGGCVAYNLQKQGATVFFADGVRTGQIAQTIADFNMQRKLNPGLGQAVGHIALSWSPNDKELLNDAVMTSIAKDYLERMKIRDTQLLIVRHQDRQHPHLHIIYNRVDNNGKTIADHFQRQRSTRICKALTVQHGFFIAVDKQRVNRKQLKGIDHVKYVLYDVIQAVSKQVFSFDQLKKELAKRGIDTHYKYRSGTSEIQGISFSKGKFKFKGSEIDRSLSYGRLDKQFSEQLQQKQIAEQQPSLAQQLREVISKAQHREPSPHHPINDPFITFPVIVPEPEEPYRKRKRKGQDNEQDQGIGRYATHKNTIQMENQSEQNLQQELADTFARKINELDKWQSKMNALQLENVPKQLKDMDKAIGEVMQLKVSDLSGQLSQYGELLNAFGQKLDAIPQSIPVKNRIEFDTRSKFVIRLLLSLGFAIMIMSGIVVALFIEMNRSKTAKNKYEIVSGFYPAIADQIDSAYAVNKDTLIQQAEINIEHRKLVLEAEAKARDARQQSDAAQKQLRQLENGISADKDKKTANRKRVR